MKTLLTMIALSTIGFGTSALADHRDRRTTSLICESQDEKYETCFVGSEFEIILEIHQRSSAACIEGVTYGLAGGRIWVDDGCRAYFKVATRGRVEETELVRCESIEGHYSTCSIGEDAEVRLAHTISSAICSEGTSWGFDSRRGYIWVDDGCRADFEVRYWRSRW